MIKILVADDHSIIRQGLRQILEDTDDMRVTGEAEGGMQAIQMAQEEDYDLLLLDINLEEDGIDGIELARQLKEEYHTQVIFISAHAKRAVTTRAAEVQPLNYLIKPYEASQVLVTLQVAAGKQSVLEGGRRRTDPGRGLTRAELRILRLIADNMTTQQIAAELGVSPSTVDNHRYNITRKLGLESRNNSLLAWAIEHRADLSAPS